MAANRSRDYYATLGVARDAKPDSIRKAYRHLARKLHPDVNPGDKAAEDRFKDVQEAYDILGDERKRDVYDRYGFYSDQASPQGSGAQGGGFGFEGFDFTDLGRQAGAGGSLGDLFDSFMGGGRGRRRESTAPRPGEDLEYAMEIGFDDAIRGTTERLRIARHSACAPCRGTGSAQGAPPGVCGTCNGTGQTQQAAGNMRFSIPCPACQGSGRVRTLCPSCGGEGRVSGTDAIDVRIPPGTQENSPPAHIRQGQRGSAGRAVR